jgi:hypothetical protein
MGQESEKFYFNEPMSTLGISVLVLLVLVLVMVGIVCYAAWKGSR